MDMKIDRTIRKAVSVVVMFSLLLALLGGCGQNQAQNSGLTPETNTSTEGEGSTDAEKTDNSAAQAGNSGQETGQQPADSQAKGRYVEEVTDLSEYISGRRNRLFQLEDGRLIISDGNKPFLVSKDNGATWEEEKYPWLSKLEEADSYIVDIAIGANFTTALVIGRMEGDEYIQEGLVIRADGTEIPMEMPSADMYPRVVGVSDEGRVFVGMNGDNIYEVKEDGSCELYLTVPNGAPSFMQIRDGLLMIDGTSYETILFYDIEKEEYAEKDEALNGFIKEYYNGGNKFSSDDGFDMYFFVGEENVLYLAGAKGLHRHVLGGSAVEQIIDGSLCTFSNPTDVLEGMVMVENNEFLALFAGAKLVRFVYDADIPTVPDELVKVYSLKENSTIQQAVSLYQTANPGVMVQYEVGIAEGSSITREDALKNLNTKIMAGEGPDVLILDDMPLDAYIEKGLLLDISALIGGMNGEEALFGNLVDAMKTGDKLYAMPCEIYIPAIAGEEKYVSQMKDLKGIADGMEALRRDNPEDEILMIGSTKGIMRFFSMACVPAWTTESGEIDREALAEFLEQAKRIYDAQMEGVSQKFIEEYNRSNENFVAEFGETRDSSKYLRTGAGALLYTSQYTKIYCGALDGQRAYAQMTSINKVSGYENTVWSVMNGQSSNVFCASTLLGINAASKHPELAEDFLRLCFGKENQETIWSGFPVNQAAFEKVFVPDEKLVDENGAFGWESMSTPEGERASFVSYWPDEKQKEDIRKCIEAADTPYIENKMLEDAVYEEGSGYLQGIRSLEDTLDVIEKRITLYLAE